LFAALGTRVMEVERRPSMLDFCDPEVVESLKFHPRDQCVTFRFGEEVAKVETSRRSDVPGPEVRLSRPRSTLL
jgi:NAD(P) transhydrogenase